MGKFIISTRTDGHFQFNLKADNGLVILTSQGYAARAGCENGIQSVQTNAHTDALYDRLTSSNEKHYFTLKSTNGLVIGTSQMYEASSGVETGIASVKANAPKATVEG